MQRVEYLYLKTYKTLSAHLHIKIENQQFIITCKKTIASAERLKGPSELST